MKTRWFHLVLVSCLSFSFGQALAQTGYQVSYHESAGNPGNLNLESDFHSIGWDTLAFPQKGSAAWFGPFSVPVDWQLLDRKVNRFWVSPNGLVTFCQPEAQPPAPVQLLPAPSLPDSTIACFWDGINPQPTRDVVLMKIFGQAPRRQWWIKWQVYGKEPVQRTLTSLVLEEHTQRLYLVDQYGSARAENLQTIVGLQISQEEATLANATPTGLQSFVVSRFDNHYYQLEPLKNLSLQESPVSRSHFPSPIDPAEAYLLPDRKAAIPQDPRNRK